MRRLAAAAAVLAVAGLVGYTVAPEWLRLVVIPSPVVARTADVRSDEVQQLFRLASSHRDAVLSPLPTSGTVRVVRHRWFSWLRSRGGTVVLWEEPRHSRVWHFAKPSAATRLMCEEEVFYGPGGGRAEALSIAVGTDPRGGACPAESGVRIERSGAGGTTVIGREDVETALKDLGWTSRRGGGA